MKRVIKYLPFILFTLAVVSFIIPAVCEVVNPGDSNETKIYYNTLELIFGSNSKWTSFSVALFIVLCFFITSIIFSILTNINPTNFRLGMAVILGLTSGTLFLFSRMLSNPSVTNFKMQIGLFLPGIFILHGAILLFVSTKIINKKDSVKD